MNLIIPKRSTAAFTLVEMLTVVAVLGILTSMVVVGGTSAKTKAIRTQCQSNLRQYGVALNSFVGSHGAYPLAINPKGYGYTADHGGMFYVSLRNEGLGPLPDKPHYKSPSVYLCPGAQRQRLPAQLGGEHAFYGYNALGFDGDKFGSLGLGFKSAEDATPVLEAAVRNPSQMITIGEGVIGWGECYQDGSWILGRLSSAKELLGSAGRVKSRHSGLANVVFCDGHVEGCALRFLFSEESDTALASWNRDHQPHRERLGEPK